MRYLNIPETPVSIQVGIYNILHVHRFADAAKPPVALVQIKKNVLQKAPADVAFYVELKSLNALHATGDTDIHILDLGGLIYVKEVELIPKMLDGKLVMDEAVEWYKLDLFRMYDLYKQQGDGALASPAEEYDGIIEALNQQEIDDTILANQALEANQDTYLNEDDPGDADQETYEDDTEE